MFRPLKKIFFTISFNISLFLMLMIGIQNSSNTRKVNLILSETVRAGFKSVDLPSTNRESS